MSKFKATIVSVNLSVQVTKQDKSGTYEAFQIVYSDQYGKVKDLSKPVQGLKFKPKLKARLQELKQGDEVYLVMEKNAAGYLELQDVVFDDGSETTTQIAPDTKPAAKATGSYQERTWETAQERADKQRFIVRQSCLSNAIEVLKTGKGAVSADDAEALASRFETWVFRKHVDDLVNDPIE